MDVAGIAGEPVIVFGHEGDRLALGIGDLLGAVLQDDVAVGHLQRLGIAHIDLFLAGAPLALGILDRNAGSFHLVAETAHDAFFLGGDTDLVVADVGRSAV